MTSPHGAAHRALFLVSLLSLFFELLVIRWIPALIGPVAYFANLLLILAFFGLGVGCLCAGTRRRWFTAFPLSVLGLTAATAVMGTWQTSFVESSVVFLGHTAVSHAPASSLPAVSILLVLLGLGALTTFSFFCLGHEIGRWLSTAPPLSAYAINLSGSLLGVVGFTALSWLQAPPLVWFAIVGGLAVWLLRQDRTKALLGLGAFLVALLVVGQPQPNVFWSPYYRIQVTPLFDESGPHRHWVGNAVDVNTAFHQYHLDLSGRVSDPPGTEAEPFLALFKEIYELPYRLAHPERVLVLGAGGGNDVAAALRRGVQQIDAVELDPRIAQLGHRHPERPYEDPRVRVIVDDARAVLRHRPETYDLVVFGFLDTLRLLSEFSSVRLESYVYTRESFQEVKRHLREGGMVVVAFSTTTRWMLARLIRLMADTFDQRPLVYNYYRESILLLRPSAPLTPVPTRYLRALTPDQVDALAHEGAPLPTDDWPFLYMERRFIPRHYLLVLGVVVLGAAAIVWLSAPVMRASFEWPFCFLGAGFMLVETLTITRLARSFGSTWLVTSVVVAVLLLTVLGATCCAARCRALPRQIVGGALLATLISGYVFTDLSALALCTLMGVTVFLAGLLFATTFQHAAAPGRAFGANILGAVMGGVLEYLSLLTGLRALYLCAVGLYLLALLGLRRGRGVLPAGTTSPQCA